MSLSLTVCRIQQDRTGQDRTEQDKGKRERSEAHTSIQEPERAHNNTGTRQQEIEEIKDQERGRTP